MPGVRIPPGARSFQEWIVLVDRSKMRDLRISNFDVIQIWSDNVDRFVFEHTDNISRSGVFVLTNKPLPIGSKVKLQFSLVADRLTEVEVDGEVIRVVNNEDSKSGRFGPAGMGVKFINLSPQIRNIIDDIINKRLEMSPSGA